MHFVAILHAPADKQAIVYVHNADAESADWGHRSFERDWSGYDYMRRAQSYADALAIETGLPIETTTV